MEMMVSDGGDGDDDGGDDGDANLLTPYGMQAELDTD